MSHLPVMPTEVLALLRPKLGEAYADCTAGLGGHAVTVAPFLGPDGLIILNDLDAANLERASWRLQDHEGQVQPLPQGGQDGTSPEAAPSTPAPSVHAAPSVRLFRGNFAELPRLLEMKGVAADMVLADLGFASNQVDDPSRGLSFSREGPLDMRLDPKAPFSAADLVASLSERELARIISEYGEDPAAGRIARKLVQARAAKPITTTSQLADLIRGSAGYSSPSRTDPATRTFQALRIAVNDELGNLDALLAGVRDGAMKARQGRPNWLKPGARVAVISFHSLEDRQVKHCFQSLVSEGLAELLTDGPLVAGEDEVRSNPRSRSAKLRAVRISGEAAV